MLKIKYILISVFYFFGMTAVTLNFGHVSILYTYIFVLIIEFLIVIINTIYSNKIPVLIYTLLNANKILKTRNSRICHINK